MRNEVRGSKQSAFRVLPAHEGLDIAHLAASEIKHGLIVDDDLVSAQRDLEFADDACIQRAPAGHCGAITGVSLCREHLHVGSTEQLLWSGAVCREQCPSNRRIDLDDAALESIRPSEGLAQPADERRRLILRAGADRDDDELIAAHASDGIARPYNRLQTPGDALEHMISGIVAADVVDLLEPVEVDDEEGERVGRSPGSPQGLLDAIVEECSVRKSG